MIAALGNVVENIGNGAYQEGEICMSVLRIPKK